MDFSDKISSNNLHHGYIIFGDKTTNKESISRFLENVLHIEIVGNPDVSYFDYTTLAIDDARLLAESQARKGFGKEKNNAPGKKIFVISLDTITHEAQNALLKIFEEPTPGTHFFILASQNTFLPTFLSRLQVVEFERAQERTLESGEESILGKSLSERLAFVTKLATDISDEKKTKQDAIKLVNQVENELVRAGTVDNHDALSECQFARNALFSRGAMVKMILENLMLQL